MKSLDELFNGKEIYLNTFGDVLAEAEKIIGKDKDTKGNTISYRKNKDGTVSEYTNGKLTGTSSRKFL